MKWDKSPHLTMMLWSTVSKAALMCRRASSAIIPDSTADVRSDNRRSKAISVEWKRRYAKHGLRSANTVSATRGWTYINAIYSIPTELKRCVKSTRSSFFYVRSSFRRSASKRRREQTAQNWSDNFGKRLRWQYQFAFQFSPKSSHRWPFSRTNIWKFTVFFN